MKKRIAILLYLLFALPSWAVTVTSKAEFLAQMPLTPGKEIIVTNQTITGSGDWGSVTITGDCTSASPCTIRPQSSKGVIFSGQDAGEFCLRAKHLTFSGFKWTGQTGFGGTQSTSCGQGPLITFDGAQNVTVDDIEITNMSGSGVPIVWVELNGGRETLNTTLSNTTIGPWTQSGGGYLYIHGHLEAGFPEGINFTNVTLRDRTMTGAGGTSNQYWMRIGSGWTSITSSNYSSGGPAVVFTNLKILRDSPANYDALHFKANNIVIQDSLFDQAGRVKARLGSGWIVRRNTFINPNAPEGLHLYGPNHTVANNLFYTTTGRSRGFTMGKGNGLDFNDDYNPFYNSIVIGNTFDGFAVAAMDATKNSNGNNQGTTTVFPQGLTFHNNIVRQQLGTMFLGPGGCAMFTSVGNNARDGAATAGCMTSGSNNLNAAPLWADPNAGNYTLQAASTLINAGTAVSGTTEDNEDHDKATRSVPPDIGAYEFAGGSPPSSTCDQIFGGATDYELCSETVDECEFNVTLGGSDCNTLCASFGKECTAAYDNSTPACTQQGTDTCSTVRATEICVCTIDDAAPPEPPVTTTSLTQHAYRFYGAFAADGEQPLAGEDEGSHFYINSRFNLTIAIRGDTGIDTHVRQLVLYYEHCSPSCAAYAAITSTCGGNPVCFADNPDREAGGMISNGIALDGKTFLSESQYIDADDPNGGESVEITIGADQQLELSYGLSIGPAASIGDTIQFRVYDVNGSPLETYDTTPSVEIGSGRFTRSGGTRQ